MPPPSLFFAALRQHKWMILLFSIIGVGAAAALVMSGGGSSFESTAKILIQENVDPDASDRKFQAPSSEVLTTQLEILTSWDVAQDVVDEIGADRILPGATKDQAVGLVLQRLARDLSRKGGLMEISYRSDDRELTSITLQKFIGAYFEKHMEIHRVTAPLDLSPTVRISLVQQPSEPREIRILGAPLWLVIALALSGPLGGCILALLCEMGRRTKAKGAMPDPPFMESPASS